MVLKGLASDVPGRDRGRRDLGREVQVDGRAEQHEDDGEDDQHARHDQLHGMVDALAPRDRDDDEERGAEKRGGQTTQ